VKTIGVLALQGDVKEHCEALERIGARPTRVRRLSELDNEDALVIPGGESTTMEKLLRAFSLFEPLQGHVQSGMPVLGTCAGMVLLADDLVGGIEGQTTLGGLDVTVRRNAFGRQKDSAETTIVWTSDNREENATFIRAPWVERVGPGVEVLARVPAYEDQVVAVRAGNVMAAAFHPELVESDTLHVMLRDSA